MAENHDRAARRIAKLTGGTYDPTASPDVAGGRAEVEVKSNASEISRALQQLSGGSGPAYVALPKRQHKAALERMQGLKTGLMDYGGNVVKPSRRKRRR